MLITTDKSEVGTMSQLEECELFKKIIENYSISSVIHHPSKKHNIDMEKVKIIDIPFLSEDIIMSSNFDNVYTLSASTVLGLESFGYSTLNKVTYLANRSAENFKNFEENSDVNLIAFEDL